MTPSVREVEHRIRDALPGAQVSVRDLTGERIHYAAYVSWGGFCGKSRVQQHQIVYRSLEGLLGDVLHALAIQTSVPVEAHGSDRPNPDEASTSEKQQDSDDGSSSVCS